MCEAAACIQLTRFWSRTCFYIMVLHQFPDLYLCDQLSILRMDTGHSTDILTVLQGLKQLAVPQHVHVLICHEHLEGVHTFVPHQHLHLSPNL